MQAYRNVSTAFLGLSRAIMVDGVGLSSRCGDVKEILGNVVRLDKPCERFIYVPGRKNNPFAQVAETLWVLAGRNDVKFLSKYLPRAAEFSDDGVTWRAGYGPRLRNWRGTWVDQLRNVYRILHEDLHSRRAVISIWDPECDTEPSKDIPCNNWINFQVRDNKLNMLVSIRSNDLMWGFTGINAFEWSVVQEILAYWLGVEVGWVQYMQGSLHLYSRHFDRVLDILNDSYAEPTALNFYDATSPIPFNTPVDKFDELLSFLFADIDKWEHSTFDKDSVNWSNEGLIGSFGLMLKLYWSLKNNSGEVNVDNLHSLEELLVLSKETPDVYMASLEYLSRKFDAFTKFAIENNMPTPGDLTPNGKEPEKSVKSFNKYLIDLHTTKGKGYGNSWIKRGEFLSVLPNVWRKSDRLDKLVLQDGNYLGAGDETVSDTLIDLTVYLAKYLGYLSSGDVSDDQGNSVLSQLPFESKPVEQSFEDAVRDIVKACNSFDEFTAQDKGVTERFAQVRVALVQTYWTAFKSWSNHVD